MSNGTTDHSPCSIKINHLENTVREMKMDFDQKVDRMERRSISAMGEFKTKLDRVEDKVGRIVVFVAVLGALSGAGGMSIVKALIGGI
jgi:hypothetical protein